MSTLTQLLSQLSLSCYPSYGNGSGISGELLQDGTTGVGSASGSGSGVGSASGVGGGGGIVPTDRVVDTTSAVSLLRHITASSSTRYVE